MKNKALLPLGLSMLIFGSVGLFRRAIPLPSGFIAFSRGAIGAAFLLIFLMVKKKPFEIEKNIKTILPLCISGALIGFNWILLFEAYNFTSVAAATLCYYMAPVIVMALSPFIFGEKLGLKKLCCVAGAVIGMVFVSGISGENLGGAGQFKGALLALGAAVLYATVVIMNKKNAKVPPFERTVIQLSSASAVILPYVIFAEEISSSAFSAKNLVLIFILGILHTGIAYAMYFGSLGNVKAQTAAIFSYIDPVTAVLISAFVLGEELTIGIIIGAVLIIGSAIIIETDKPKAGKENP